MLFRSATGTIALSVLLPLTGLGQNKMRVEYNLNAAHAAGLAVWAGTDPKFADLATQVLQNPRTQMTVTDGMKPFTLLVKNTSGKAVAFIGVRYLHTHYDRPERPWDICIGTTSQVRPALKPDEVTLITPGIQVSGPSFVFTTPRSAQAASNEFETATSVVVNFDSVIFEDGTVYGPDNIGTALRYEGERLAMGEIIGSLRTLKLEGFDKVVQYGERLAALRAKSAPSSDGRFANQSFWHDSKLQAIGMRVASLKNESDLDQVIASLTQAYGRLSSIQPK